MTKKEMSKLINSFPQPNTHDLYFMMLTICDHDLCAPDPTINFYEPTTSQSLINQMKNSSLVFIQNQMQKDLLSPTSERQQRVNVSPPYRQTNKGRLHPVLSLRRYHILRFLHDSVSHWLEISPNHDRDSADRFSIYSGREIRPFRMFTIRNEKGFRTTHRSIYL